MIELNILKERLEKFRKKRVVFNLFIIYFGGLVFIVLALSLNFMGNKIQVLRIKQDIEKIERRMETEKEVISSIGRKGKETENLLKNLSFFTSEFKKRVIWTEKLAFIGKNIPLGIWLSKLVTAPPKDKKASGKLTLSGYLLPEAVNERETVDRFVRILNDSGLFKAVSLKEVRRDTRERREVVSFEISCELK